MFSKYSVTKATNVLHERYTGEKFRSTTVTITVFGDDFNAIADEATLRLRELEEEVIKELTSGEVLEPTVVSPILPKKPNNPFMKKGEI